MRKLLIVLLAALLASGAAFAQDDVDVDVDVEGDLDMNMRVEYATTQWAGVALGYPFTFYYGVEDVFQDADIRARLSSYLFDVSVGADVLFDITTLEELPVTVYAGGGPNIGLAFGFGNAVGIGLSGVVGAEYRFDEQIGAFLDVGAGATFYFGDAITLPSFFAPRGALGVNFHF